MSLKPLALVLVLIAAAVVTIQAGEISSFPFEFTDGLIWVKVTAEGRSLNFVLDSGAGSSVLSLEVARRPGVKLRRPMAVQTVQGLITGYRVSEFPGVVGGIAMKQDMIAMDLRGESKGCHRSIDGLNIDKGEAVKTNSLAQPLPWVPKASSS